eukprot:TRINITY_DN1124_c0_g2_i1.p1 TRINITY_DN1124_c0_g2~~TRINITY_DN1124_c0_g2_i1.p1  ORF type:complete len:250 (-),score=77.34 TRINITY_DN1124_c0_g2_i1:201-950(-)
MISRLCLVAWLLVVVSYASDFNVVNLDNSTIKLLLGKDLPAFVRFDKEYAYGEKADAFKALAAAAAGSKVIIGTVGISTYGDMMNQDLAEAYGYKALGANLEFNDMEKVFPKFRFFPAHGGKDVEYTGDVTSDAMISYLKKESKIYFGLKGTVKDFDKLAAEFVKASDKAGVLQQAKAASEKAEGADKEAAAYYVKAMEKTSADADWFTKEFARLKKLISGDKLAPQQKADMQSKINRLSAFVSPNDEL